MNEAGIATTGRPASPARRTTLWALALIVLATLLLHREVLFGGSIYHMDDAADGYYPCHVAIERAYREGHLPAWERGAALGWPLVADPYYGPFYPLGALFAVFGAARGLGVQIALHTVLCGAGMLLLLRRRGVPPWSAAFGAVSLALSSFMVCRIRHIIFPEGLAWLTFALAGAEGYLQTRARRELVLIGGAVGLTLLCGALPLLPFFGLFAACYVAPRLRLAPRPLVTGSVIVGSALVGLMLAGVQLLPTLSHLPLSPRALGTSYAFASSYAWPNAAYLGTLLVPDLFGVEDRAHWFGAFNHWEMAGYYVGAWAILLSPFAFRRARRGATLEGALLSIAAIAGIVLAFGDGLPLHGWFYRHVPLYAALRCPTRALVMTMLAAAVMSAEGLSTLTETLGRVRTRGWLGVASAIAVTSIVVAVLLVKTKLFHVGIGTMPPAELQARAAFAHFAVVLGAGLAILCVNRWDGAPGAIAPLMVLVALLDLSVANRGYVQPKPADYAEGTDRFQAIDWLLQQHPTERLASDAHGPFRLHNVGMTYGIESAAAYSSVQIFRYVNFLEVLATGHGLPTPLGSDPAASDVRRFDSPLVDLLNVRWVISDHRPALGYVERFHPRGDSTAPASRHEPSWDRRLAVWENPNVLPRAFVVHQAQIIADEVAEQRALARLDPRTTVLLEKTPSVTLPSTPLPFDPATMVEKERDKIVIEAHSDAPGVLVTSEAAYPGWSVTVDGASAELLRVDYALRGVALPAGTHRVEMRYRSTPLRIGMALSVVALLLLVLLASLPDRRRRLAA